MTAKNSSHSHDSSVSDLLQLDQENQEFNFALEFILNHPQPVFITGKAGTGKTTFLKQLRKLAGPNTIVLAPTGVAAINAGGQTIHSYFKIKPGIFPPNDKRLRFEAEMMDEDRTTIYDHFKYYKNQIDKIKATELLIIDEISMVRCDLLDLVDKLLRYYRNNYYVPFGGVQVVLIGDPFQLSPIAEHEHWEILKMSYETEFFFSAHVIKEHPPVTFELQKIYRQTDPHFIQLLNRIRVNQVNQEDLELLNSKYNPHFTPPQDENYIILATHNRIVNQTNSEKLEQLTTLLHQFEAVVEGTFPENIYPTESVLKLKEGAQVMFIKNNNASNYFNGKIGIITKIEDETIWVKCDGDQNEIVVAKEIWVNMRYKYNTRKGRIEEEEIGSFVQYPLRLAWAITVHKSQGLTFEKVIADIGGSFADGQVYVALSRCTNFNHLVLKSPIPPRAIRVNKEVIDFFNNLTPLQPS